LTKECFPRVGESSGEGTRLMPKQHAEKEEKVFKVSTNLLKPVLYFLCEFIVSGLKIRKRFSCERENRCFFML
jgi:hypothetical protein